MGLSSINIVTPLFCEIVTNSVVVPVGEKWFVKQLIVQLNHLVDINDVVAVKVAGKEIFYPIVSGERKIEAFRHDILFVKVSLLFTSYQTVCIHYRDCYKVWFEGEKHSEP